jgi:hypothetical protein
MKYYVIYVSKDVGWYQTERYILCVVENEEIAKDITTKNTHLSYKEVTVGAPDRLVEELKVS